MRMPLAVIAVLVLAVPASAQPTVAVDFSGLEEATFRQLDVVALEKSAAVRLVQEGFAVVAKSPPPVVLVHITVRASPRVVVLEASGPAGSARGEAPWGDEPLAELHLEVVQKLVQLARATAPARAGEPPLPPPPPPAEPAPPWQLGVGVGVRARDGGVDPLGLLSVRRGAGVRLALEGGLTGGRGPGISVFDAHLAGGIELGWQVAPHLELAAGVVVGGLLHTFALDDAAALEPSGARVTLYAAAPLSALFHWPSSSLTLGLRVAPAFSPGFTHLREGVALWRRGPFLADAAVSLTWKP